jgi:hypothetical protein
MDCPQIVKGPVSMEAARGNTCTADRMVLVAAHHFTGATRLMDIVPLVESDRRIQVVYTVPPISIFARSAHEFLHDTGALVIPWGQAVQRRFDLVLAAGQGLLEELHAPIMMFQHGAGPYSYQSRLAGYGPLAPRGMGGLGLRGLIIRGRVVPSALMMAHEDHTALLRSQCPEAVPAAVIAGDICFDRILESRSRRTAYRNALGAGPSQRVVIVSSHWGKSSLLGRRLDLLQRLAEQLPSEEYRIVAVLHPHVWAWHGRRQVSAWLAPAVEAGVVLLPPEEGWRAALVAGDMMIGDRGSVTCYGGALGLPVLLAPYSTDDVVPGSLYAFLGQVAPRLDLDGPLPAQLEATQRSWSAAYSAELAERIASHRGRAAAVTRRAMYELMRLTEPAAAPVIEPVPCPVPLGPVAQ